MKRTIPYATQWVDAADIKAVGEVLKSDWLTQGPVVRDFEDKMAKYCGVKYAVAVNSGTSALHAACFAADISLEDEVITSPISFVASANCILYCGGKPVFADIQADTINIDPKGIETKITDKTKAIIPIHFAGHPSDLEEIQSIARKKDLIVIEDACHALGAEYKGSKIGSCKYSDMTILSFHAVKHITTGEGGMILTNNRDYYEKLLMFRTHGITKKRDKFSKIDEGNWYYEMRFLGFNYRITDFQCALGINQLKKLSYSIEKRRKIVANYNRAFSKYEEITYLKEERYVASAHHLYILRFPKDKFLVSRKEIFDTYRRKGILVNVHYIPVYWQPYYKKLGYGKGLCPKAEDYYEEAITLPLFPKMKELDVNRVIKATKDIVLKFRRS